MFSSPRIAAGVFAVLSVLVAVPTVAAQEDETAAVPTLETFERVVDDELVGSLTSAGLFESWLSTADVHPDAAVAAVTGSAAHAELRSAVIARADAIATSRSDELALVAEVAEVEVAVEALEAIARNLRARQIRDPDPMTDRELAALRKVVLQARTSSDLAALSDAVDTIESIRDDLDRELTAARRTASADKTPDAGSLTTVLRELDDLNRELLDLRAEAMKTTEAEAALIASVEADLPELHRLRALAITEVEGLPLVTLDAYLSAGDHGIDGCTVDWALLAGIGRIESIHGTLGGASVAASGAVSPRVFGPLLDGGAGSQAAIEARQAAEAKAAEQARLAAEEAAREAERLAREEEARRSRLYGDLSAPTPEELEAERIAEEEAAAAERAAVEAAAAAEAAESDADDATSLDEETDEDDTPPGNGFAVIVDSDNGVLDGNPDWDRAVGPMQFLPETWSYYDVDGNGDGVIDPHNLYDAARSAAEYLCHLERRNGGASPWVYVHGYNDSTTYVASVMETAARMATHSFALTD